MLMDTVQIRYYDLRNLLYFKTAVSYNDLIHARTVSSFHQVHHTIYTNLQFTSHTWNTNLQTPLLSWWIFWTVTAILVQSYPHGQFLYFTLLNQKVGLVVSTCPLRSPAPSLAPAGPPSSHSASVVLAPEGEKSYTLTLPTDRENSSWIIMICIFEYHRSSGEKHWNQFRMMNCGRKRMFWRVWFWNAPIYAD